ncbi:unnamed protein product [Linum trigynum]|uniref:Uncharacterized protein n=1 Tax=Linum trigynum TaxID=586398 RepID=A0AAV2EWU5_9ROSI
MDSCFWTLIGTSPSSSWPPMVLKINLGHLGTLARHFLSLGTDLSLKKLQSPFFGSEFGLKPGNPDSHGQGARPCISPFWPCNSKRSVSFSRTSALSHGHGARPCELQGLPVRVLGIRRTAILLTCTAVQPPWSARAAPQKPRYLSVLRPIDPRLAPKPSFTY